jgi:type IV pilus assembly protein PilA
MKYPRCSIAVAFSVLLAGLWLAGCGPRATEAPPAPPQVPAEGRSPVAAAIANHLEYGGEVFAVFDINGDLAAAGDKYASLLSTVLKQAPAGSPYAKLDFHALFQRLGLYGIAGGGISSWRVPNDVLYHNRAFLYVPDGRQGLLQIAGDAPAPFISPTLAPVDTDLAYESTLNLKSLADLVLGYVSDIGGPDLLQTTMMQIKQPVAPNTNVTWQWLLNHLNTRIVLAARADATLTIPIEANVTIPQVDFVLSFDGMADLFTQLTPLLQAFGTLGEKNGVQTATLAIPLPKEYSSYQPELLADPKTQRLYLVSRPAFADVTIFGQGPRLATSDDFLAATSGLPTVGNGFSYVSKKGIDTFIKNYAQAFSNLPPESQKAMMQSIYGDLARLPHGIASTQANLPDGILVQSIAPQSNKTILLLGPAVALGLTSAMAIPAFTKVRAQSQTKAITNNLRQLASAGQQYMLDKGVTQAGYRDLVGNGTDKYIRSISPVAGENYQDMTIYQTTTQISTRTADGTVVTYNL